MDTKLLEIGHRLCTQRKKKGLTQDALAEKANVSAQTIAHAELGKRLCGQTLLLVSVACWKSVRTICCSGTHPLLIFPP